jgi:hypothetical protein
MGSALPRGLNLAVRPGSSDLSPPRPQCGMSWTLLGFRSSSKSYRTEVPVRERTDASPGFLSLQRFRMQEATAPGIASPGSCSVSRVSHPLDVLLLSQPSDPVSDRWRSWVSVLRRFPLPRPGHGPPGPACPPGVGQRPRCFHRTSLAFRAFFSVEVRCSPSQATGAARSSLELSPLQGFPSTGALRSRGGGLPWTWFGSTANRLPPPALRRLFLPKFEGLRRSLSPLLGFLHLVPGNPA